MPEVDLTVRNPGGSALAGATVRWRLVASTNSESPGFGSTYIITNVATTHTDTAGFTSLVLDANVLLTPANTFYEILVSEPNRKLQAPIYISVPNSTGPFNVNDILVVPPTNLPAPTLMSIQDEGAAQGNVATTNYTGAGVTATVAGTVATVNIPGGGGAGGAPVDADFLVGTANATLTNEVVVGPTPGGELGGTWPSPTVATVHAGSAHHSQVHAIDGADHTGDIETAQIANDAVTFAKMQNVAASKVIGRGSAGGTGDPEEITLGSNLSMSGTTLNAATTGGTVIVQEDDVTVDAVAGTLDFGSGLDVTSSPAGEANISVDLSELSVGGDLGGTANAPTINANAIGNTKLRDSAGTSVIGKASAGTGDPADIAAGSDDQLLGRRAGALTFAKVATAELNDDAVTYAKIQNISAASKLLGRGSAAGAGDTQELALGTNLSLSGTTLNASASGLDGVQAVTDFAALGAVAIDTAEATTNWKTQTFSSPATAALDAVNFTQGSNSVTASIKTGAQPGAFWLNLEQTGVTATELGTTATYTTPVAHSFLDGQSIVVAGMSVSGYNGTVVITSHTSTTFVATLGTSGLGAGTGGIATPALSTHLRIMFDLLWRKSTLSVVPSEVHRFFVASAANGGGTKVNYAIPSHLIDGLWTKALYLDVINSGLTQIGSFGIEHNGTVLSRSTSDDTTYNIDDVRWDDASAIDVGVISQGANTVLVPEDFAPGGTQWLLEVPSTKTLMDLRPGKVTITNSATGRSVRDYALSRTRSVGQDANRIVSLMSAGEILNFDGGAYQLDEPLNLNGVEGVTILGNGISFYRTLDLNLAHIVLGADNRKPSREVTVDGFRLFFYRNDSTVATTALSTVVTNMNAPEDTTQTKQGPFDAVTHYTASSGAKLSPTPELATTQGGFAFQLVNQNTTAQNVSAALPTGSSSILRVEPSVGYTMTCKVRAIDQGTTTKPAHFRTLHAIVKWYTSGGASAGADSDFSAVETDKNTWLTISGTPTSPATAALASITIQVDSAGGASPGLTNPVTATRISANLVEFTITNHNAEIGQVIKASNYTADTPVSAYNGSWQVVSITDANRFRVTTTLDPVTSPDSSGRVQMNDLQEAHAFDDIRLVRTAARTLGTSGTDILLAEPNDEVKATARIYGRDKDGLVRTDFTMAVTTGTSDTLQLRLLDDETEEVLATSNVTVTSGEGTVTKTLSWKPGVFDLIRSLRASIRKTGATATTTSVKTIVEYNRNDYRSSFGENGHGVAVQSNGAINCTVSNIMVEGGGSGDGVTVQNGCDFITTRNIWVRGNNRQGNSDTGGNDHLWENIVSIGPGRSGFDIEPAKPYYISKRCTVRNMATFRVKNDGWTNTTGRTEDLNVDGFLSWKAGLAGFSGGGRTGTLANIRSILAGNTTDVTIAGDHVVAIGVQAESGIALTNTSGNYVNTLGNLLTSTSGSIICIGASIRNPLDGYSVADTQSQFIGAALYPITPTSLSTSQNNYSPTSLNIANEIRQATSANVNLTGLALGWAGREIRIVNLGSANIVLTDEDAVSTAANRFALDAAVTIKPDQIALVRYDGSSSRWRAVSFPTSDAANAVQTTGGGLETVKVIGNSGSAKTLALVAGTDGNIQTVTNSASCIYTMPSGLTSSKGIAFLLIVTNNGAFTATFTGVKWAGGTAPVLTSGAGKVDKFVFETIDGGTTWYGSVAGQDFA